MDASDTTGFSMYSLYFYNYILFLFLVSFILDMTVDLHISTVSNTFRTLWMAEQAIIGSLAELY